MIKIFNANDKDFSSAGNIIIEPIKCIEIKKKSLNDWYIEVEVPIKYKEYISKDRLCVVKTKSKLNPQAFRVGEEIEYSTRKIKFKAKHVMFDAKDYALLDVRPTNQNGLNALNYINERTDNVSPFTMHSNVENVNTAYFIRKNLLEAWAIIEERWGGVFDADNWNISFLTSVGNDNGETIAYGKNMQGFNIFEDWSSVCTKLYPIGYDGLMLPEEYISSDVEYEKPYTRIIDFQTDLEGEEQTEENLLQELRIKAESYLEENKVPKVSYTIISNINNKLEIGDTIKVLHPFVNIFTEVLEYEYNLIAKKVVSLTFGNYSRDVKTKFNNIKNTIEQINQVVSKQEVVINNQTSLINSLNKNGYVYIDENEILILDTIPKEKSKNVWRFGLGGIGFSSNGYEGPFEVAMTMDGQINANFITTGTLSVSRIEGLANFISETEKQISNIEIEQGNITSRVESAETSINNIIDTTSEAEGKLIHIKDSAEEPLVDISLHGETRQETRSGKNLCDDKFSSYTISSYGYKQLIDEDTTLTATLIDKDTSVDLSGVYFGFTGNGVNADAGVTWLVQNGTRTEFSTNFNAHYFSFYPANETTFNKIFSRYYIQIEKGGPTEYEQYGASPSPYYPSEIENVEGRNKFDKTKSSLGKILNVNNGIEGNAGTIVNTSDYIRVYKGKNYIIKGVTTETTYYYNYYICLYDLNKTYIERQTMTDLKNKTFSFTPSQDGFIKFSYVNNISELQLEEGAVTPYVPYNSLEVKVEGKNKFDKNVAIANKYLNENGQLFDSTSWGITDYIGVLPNKKYVSWGTSNTGVNPAVNFYDSNKNYIGGIKHNNINPFIFTTPENCKYIRDSFYLLDIDTFMIEEKIEGTEPTDYESYKSQTAYFPLAEGQKLMEGSYLADDGVHNVRGQTILPTINSLTTVTIFGTKCKIAIFALPNAKSVGRSYDFVSDKIGPANEVFGEYKAYRNQTHLYVLTTAEDTIENFNLKIAGSTVEYELAEEEIVPYTEEQQKAWNKIKTLTTYKNITNITLDAYAKIVYARDNGLDIYETKQDAENKYIETTEKFAEQKITIDGIKSEVSSTQTTVGNYYKELTGKFDDYAPKSDIVSIQKSVTTLQTDTYTKTEINTKLIDGSVEKVLTTAGTFDENGLTIEKTNAKTKGNFNEKGIAVMDATSGSSQELLFAGYDEELNETIVRSKNMTVEKYFVESNIARREEYSNPVLGGKGIGVFML